MSYRVGQKFKKYTPDVAIWCNKNGYHIEKDGCSYVIKDRSDELKLTMAKQQKKRELKRARDTYLQLKGYDLSENDKFNLVNLIGGYGEEERQAYFDFLNNDLIPKYNQYSQLIKDEASVEGVEKIWIDFEEKSNLS